MGLPGSREWRYSCHCEVLRAQFEMRHSESVYINHKRFKDIKGYIKTTTTTTKNASVLVVKKKKKKGSLGTIKFMVIMNISWRLSDCRVKQTDRRWILDVKHICGA